MYIVVQPELLKQSNDWVLTAALLEQLGGTKYSRFEGTKAVAFGLDLEGEEDIETYWDSMLAVESGLEFIGVNWYIEMPNSALDNLVPVDFPEAKYTSGEEEVRRQWQQYGHIIQGDSTFLWKIFPCSHNPAFEESGQSAYLGLVSDAEYYGAKTEKYYGIKWETVSQFVTWAEGKEYSIIKAHEVADWRAANEVTDE